MKIFVSGSLKDIEIVRIMMDVLKSHEHTITEDWTEHKFKGFDTEYAKSDLLGIKECDAFILYVSETKSSGKMFEFGYAAALKKPIFIFGNKRDATSVFFKLGYFQFCKDINELVNKLNDF